MEGIIIFCCLTLAFVIIFCVAICNETDRLTEQERTKRLLIKKDHTIDQIQRIMNL